MGAHQPVPARPSDQGMLGISAPSGSICGMSLGYRTSKDKAIQTGINASQLPVNASPRQRSPYDIRVDGPRRLLVICSCG